MQKGIDSKKNNDGVKEILKSYVKDNEIVKHKLFILELLNDNILDSIIDNIPDTSVIIKSESFLKKNLISSYENFIYNLDNFITYLLNTVGVIDIIESILKECLKCDINNILLSTNYVYDDTYLEEYVFNYNLMIVSNFYDNLNFFYEEFKDKYKTIGLDIKNINLDNKKDLEILLSLLEEICFVNKDNSYNLLSLFKKKEENDISIIHIDKVLSKYLDNLSFVLEYRKFRKKYNNIF